MDDNELNSYVDQRRWLINNGLLTDDIKNQLFFCGSIAHKEIQAVELAINVEEKIVDYKLYVEKSLIKQIEQYNELSTRKDLYGMWKFKRLLKKQGCLDLQSVLNKFVTDYLGSQWKTKVEVGNLTEYEEQVGEQSESEQNQRSNQSPI